MKDVLGGVAGGGVLANLNEASLALTPSSVCSASVSSMTPPRERRGRAKRKKSMNALMIKMRTRKEKKLSRNGMIDKCSPTSGKLREKASECAK